MLSNLRPDAEGQLTINREELAGMTLVRVVAVDPDATVERSVRFESLPLQHRDLRLATTLDPSRHFCQTKQIQLLRAGDRVFVKDLASSRFQYFDEIGDVFRLFLMLNPNTRLADFEFLLDWSSRSEEEKRSLYSEHACHELNYYFYRKDRPFFDQVIKPHLGFKAEQGIVDQFLIDEELTPFLKPWQYSKLNVFEKILLAQRSETQSRDIIRNLDDQYLLKPTRREWFDSLYNKSLGVDGLVWNERQNRPNAPRPIDLPQLGGLATGDEISAEELRRSERRQSAGQILRGGGGGGGLGRQPAKNHRESGGIGTTGGLGTA